MNVVIRADASARIGMGHIMRCLALASALRERGAAVFFVCREHRGHLCDAIAAQNFHVLRLPVPDAGAGSADPTESLDGSWDADAEQTVGAITAAGVRPDWIVVDHYAIDERWEKALRADADRIMVIDDMANRPHDCDLLLDQNLVSRAGVRYTGKLPDRCACLLGPEYALLQSVYSEHHDGIPPRSGSIRRVLISFGGADTYGCTTDALDAFLRLERADIDADVVLSATALDAEVVRRRAAGHANVHIHQSVPSLAFLMAKADLAIGAGGVTTWERLCFGLPTLVVTLANNQRATAEELDKRGLIRWVGHCDDAYQNILIETLRDTVRAGITEEWSRACSAVVDGKGCKRVCAVLAVSASTPLKARCARLDDQQRLLNWVNDPVTRRNAFATESISSETHHAWFRARLRDLESTRLYVVETDDEVPIGQVRFDREEQHWTVHYALAPEFRGRGCGSTMLDAARREFRKKFPDVPICGHVKNGNIPSQRVFEKLGFQKRRADAKGVEYVCTDYFPADAMERRN